MKLYSITLLFAVFCFSYLNGQAPPDLSNVSIKLENGNRLNGIVKENYKDQLLFKSDADTFYMIKKTAIDTINLRVLVNEQFIMSGGNSATNFFKDVPEYEYKSGGSYISSGASTQLTGVFINILGAGLIAAYSGVENPENGKPLLFIGSGLSLAGAICQVAGLVKFQRGGELLMGEKNSIGY